MSTKAILLLLIYKDIKNLSAFTLVVQKKILYLSSDLVINRKQF